MTDLNRKNTVFKKLAKPIEVMKNYKNDDVFSGAGSMSYVDYSRQDNFGGECVT